MMRARPLPMLAAQEEQTLVRQDLLNYCERDTWAMVKVLERLWELASGNAP